MRLNVKLCTFTGTFISPSCELIVNRIVFTSMKLFDCISIYSFLCVPKPAILKFTPESILRNYSWIFGGKHKRAGDGTRVSRLQDKCPSHCTITPILFCNSFLNPCMTLPLENVAMIYRPLICIELRNISISCFVINWFKITLVGSCS